MRDSTVMQRQSRAITLKYAVSLVDVGFLVSTRSWLPLD